MPIPAYFMDVSGLPPLPGGWGWSAIVYFCLFVSLSMLLVLFLWFLFQQSQHYRYRKWWCTMQNSHVCVSLCFWYTFVTWYEDHEMSLLLLGKNAKDDSIVLKLPVWFFQWQDTSGEKPDSSLQANNSQGKTRSVFDCLSSGVQLKLA